MRFASRCWITALTVIAGLSLIADDSLAAGKAHGARKRPRDYTVMQIRPRAWRSRAHSRAAFAPYCALHLRSLDPRPGTRKTIADALIEAPRPETIEELRRYGIPALEGIPPVVIIFPEQRRTIDARNY